MTEQQILTKAIQKAIGGGFTDDGQDWLLWAENMMPELYLNVLIYNHDFAKALWGEEIVDDRNVNDAFLKRVWQYHLQQMVIAEDPIQYLGENI